MDTGIWATWYDLEASGAETYLSWLHDDYLPWLRGRAGVAWVAHYRSDGGGEAMHDLRGRILSRPDEEVGQGAQYVLLVGAASPHVFLDPSIHDASWHRGEADAAMLGRRLGTRTAIFAEEARVTGPASGTRPAGSTPAPAIQFGTFRVRSLDEEFDLGCWYAQYRLPFMAQMTGSVATRKLVCVAGWPKHGILYEFTSLEDRLANFETPHESFALDPKEWTGRVVRYTVHAPGSPTVAERLWPPVTG